MAKKLKWGTIEYLNVLIDEYFETEPMPSITGLRLHLGISDNCWRYYVSDSWKTHRKSESEIEEIASKQVDIDDNEIYEELVEITANCYISEDKSSSMNIEEDVIKSLVSLTLKKARDHIDTFIYKTMLSAKNPAGAIFYAKAALGYRETTPEESNQTKAPSQITINILPQPSAPMQIIEAVPTTYSVLPDKGSK